TDYNDGFVLPAAIDRDMAVVAAPRDDRRLRLHSLNTGGPVDLDLDALRPSGEWHDYVAGVAAALMGAGHILRGLDLTLDGTVPLGAGLSSSAALEVASALAFTAASGLTVPPRDLALLCQRAEHDFVGAQVGIMDQFISVFGRRDHALFLDCRSLATEAIPLHARDLDLAFVVCDSGVKHALASGEYNRRRQECAEAVAILRAHFPDRDIRALRDVTPEMLEAAQAAGAFAGQPTVERRARHVVGENARVEATIAAIRAGDWNAVGAALYASHASLRDDYEVSVPEIDALVAIALGVEGVLGSRLMGGGFGGSTITILRRAALPDFSAAVEAGYRARFDRAATVYPVEIVDGAGVLPLGEA
ncbi:MAG: galactokinase, partial [Chloroflexota bacterium]|nr:galactokinase [Chloroflexota bacterium]